MWCIPKIDAEYVARMEDVLDLYAEAADPARPVVCFDESPTQLIGEVRRPIPAELGGPERYDCEYRRNGTANLFVFLDAHRCWRKVKVTERRTAEDFAHCMRDLIDVHHPEAACIRVVLDNLSTHTSAALYQAFPAAEARRILRRLEFHYTPKHVSWLNMVEIEIGVLRGQCLNRRIESRDRLVAEVAAWEHRRNASAARINWMFSTEQARVKLAHAGGRNPFWVHGDSRRRFVDALKAGKKAGGPPEQALRFFEQLYRVERQARDETPDKDETQADCVRRFRQKHSILVLNALKEWLDGIAPQQAWRSRLLYSEPVGISDALHRRRQNADGQQPS